MPGADAVNVVSPAVDPGAASQVSKPCVPVGVAAVQLLVTLKPGNRREVLPAAVGRLLVRWIVTTVFSVTTMVGPGTTACCCRQVGVKAKAAAGTNVGDVPATQPYPHE